ncbi:MAG: hypothetical protein R6V08_09315, partial [Desulfuromonadales bacterium]
MPQHLLQLFHLLSELLPVSLLQRLLGPIEIPTGLLPSFRRRITGAEKGADISHPGEFQWCC